MFASHRRAGSCALFAVVLLLGGLSCARGSGGSGTSAPANSASIEPSQVNAPDAASASSSYGTPGGDAAPTAVAADDPGDDDALDVEDAAEAGDDATDPVADDGGDEAPGLDPSIATPAAGDLAITEVMLSPSGPEPQSEWFEIYNLASSPRLLNGLTIEDGYGDTDVIASATAVVAPPAAYVLLVRDETTAAGMSIPASAIVYAYGAGVAPDEGIELDDGSDGDLSLWSGGTLLADVPYGMWDAAWVGQSIELATPQSDASDPTRWCHAESPWASGSDDGTPGAPSDCGP
jgi:hypothetical protein